MTISQAFALAVQHHQAGRLAEAEAICRQILSAEPRYVDALHLLGIIALQAGRSDLAVNWMRQASALNPTDPEVHSNLGEAYRNLGQFEEAIAQYRRALQLKPDYAEAHSNLGGALADRGQADEAIVEFRRALQLKPELGRAHYHLGNVLNQKGQFDEAIEAYRHALQFEPSFAEAHNNLGNALMAQGRIEEAIASFHRALQLQPALPEVHNNLGNALVQQGRLDEAIASFRRALELRPGSAEVHNNLGNSLKDQGRLDEAIASFRRALELSPDFAEVFSNLGNALSNQGRIEDAVESYRRALELRPDRVEAHANLLLSLHYSADLDGETIFREHVRWDEIHARPLAKWIEPHPNDPNPDRRLRIGYVSPDFRLHSVAFFLENLLASHDRAEVEVFCYADLRRADAVTARLREQAGHWREITGMTDAQAAELIRRDQIDILVDLAGHTERSRLLIFARKPAPVQVSYVGYCDTTGMKTMDYRLTDAHADPPGTTGHLHTEQLIRLPDCAWCFRPSADAPPVGDLPVRHTGGVTFGSFNTQRKITEEMLGVWSRILREVPGSRLLLKNLGLEDRSSQQRVRGLIERTGVASERVEILGRIPTLAEHLNCYQQVDLALDTFPYHGTTTTCEALWMGVPVITLAGRTHASRVGVSLLSNVGLPEMIARDAEEYVRIAVKLSADLPRLAALRASLRERMAGAPLMDGPRFARNVEVAYRQMWRTWCANRPSLPPT